MGNLAVAAGGQVLMAARDRYLSALTALMQLASLQVGIASECLTIVSIKSCLDCLLHP